MGIFLILGVIAACKGPGCLVHEKIVDSATHAVANTLECDNFPAIREDIDKVVGALGLCKADEMPKGPLADAFCPMVADTVVEFVYKNGIPAKYGCKATKAREYLKSVLTTQCKRLPVEYEEKH